MLAENGVVSSTPVDFRLRWDVFLSFRGTDTRNSFVDVLYNSLNKLRDVRVFRDNEGMDRGDEISQSLLEAIEDSAAAIVVLSPNYASSHWCLEELAKICQCRRLILPVFCWVDPSDVRKQKGPFEEAFQTHEARFGKEKVLPWRKAMTKVGGLAGYVLLQNSEEATLVRCLIQRVVKELSNTPLSVTEYAVGLDARVEEVMNLLDVKSREVRVLGLYGMGGIGKTTLAKVLFNQLVHHFGRRSFISNVREGSSTIDDLISLQNRLIGDLSKGATAPVNDLNAGVAAINNIFYENRILVVLDDVDNVNQLDYLIGKKVQFYEGGCIVITTRDRQVLTENYVDVSYEVKELNSSEALQLFSYHALRRKEPADKFSDLSNQIVCLTGGLPLALEVFGSFLFGKRRIKEWVDALEKLRKIRPGNLQGVLKISFDGLDEQERCIFLDIACLLVQMEMKRDDAIDILRGCGFGAELSIKVLTEKCLIKITQQRTLWMHDQVRDMGRQIVLDENLVDPGMRSRLWDRSEILAVLKGAKGTRCVEGIVLDFQKKRPAAWDRDRHVVAWDSFRQKPSFNSALTYVTERYKKYVQDRAEKATKAILQTKHFEPMVGLRLLQINYSILEGKFRCLPSGLKWLQWKQCPLRNIPLDYCPSELAVLDLSNSNINTMWGRHRNKVAEKLITLNLSNCHNLATIPDLTGNLSLEKIVLENCTRLINIHESLGNLNTLIHLNLSLCESLIELPSDVSGLKHLENLLLSGCRKLKALPKDISCMVSLRQLLIDETAIRELPESIFHLTKLENLSANGCHNLKRLPNCIGKLQSLQELFLNHTALEELPDSVGSLENLVVLSLMGCKSLTMIPDTVGKLISLTHLYFDRSGLKELPDSIGSLSYLRHLSVGGCNFLSKLPDSVEALASTVELQLDETSIASLPDQIGAMKMLRKLEMKNCKLLRFLPVTIGGLSGLTTLDMYNANITELPESIGMLESLVLFRLDMCKQLKKLPASMGKLKSLRGLQMKETALTELPDSFGMLSSLVKLDMERRPYLKMTGNSMSTGAIIPSRQEEPNSVSILTSFCNLTRLEELNAHGWRISGKIPDDFEKLSSLETLKLGHNNICSLPASMKGLSSLKMLSLPDCRELTFLPPLPSSLTDVNVANCSALQYVSDISNLDRLEELNLTNCEKVVDIPGLEHLKSLRRLYLNGCNGCSYAVKKRLSKVLLKKLKILIMPGSKIPDWFLGESVRFSKHRNRQLKGIICAGVLSFDHIPDNVRDELSVVDVQAKLLNLTDVVYTTTFRLLGIPSTNEEHIFLHRFGDYTPLVSQVKDRYTLHLTKRNPPYVEGLELKKSGICLVLEGDDDYEGEEGTLDESQQSVSQRLANFFNSIAEDGPCV